MMKRFAILLAAAALALPAPAGAASGDAALDRASAELAASLVLRDLRAELRAKPADPAALRDAMLADPAANADPSDIIIVVYRTYKDLRTSIRITNRSRDIIKYRFK